MMDYDDLDEDLPWDGLWEYVLGDEFDDYASRRRPSSFRRHRSEDTTASDVTHYLLLEDGVPKEKTKVKSSTPSNSESKKRLSFPRQSSFNRQASHQSTSTTGSTSSSRLKSIMSLGRKRKEKAENDSASSFFESFAHIDARDDPGLSASREGPSLMGRLSSSFDDGNKDESQDTAARTQKKEKKPFWKKKEDKVSASTAGSAEFSFGFPGASATEQASAKKEKRKKFWKRSKSASALDSHESGKDYAESNYSDEHSTDLESIDGLLGPWKGGSAAVNDRSSTERGNSIKTDPKKTMDQEGNNENSKGSDKIRPKSAILKAVTRFRKDRSDSSTKKTEAKSITNNARTSIAGSSNRSKTKTRRNHNDDDSIEEPGHSFLPPSLLLWQQDDSDETESVSCDSTTSEKSNQIESLSVSGASSTSDLSEQGATKKQVSWAEDVNSVGQEAEDNVGVSFANWLYSTVTSSEEETDSSEASSANQSSQSEELSSVVSESDASTGGVSSKGDYEKEDGQAAQQIQDNATSLPAIDENLTLRSSSKDTSKDEIDNKSDPIVSHADESFQHEVEERSKMEIIGRVEPENSKSGERSGDINSNEKALLVQNIASSRAVSGRNETIAKKKQRKTKKSKTNKKKTRDSSKEITPRKNAQSRISFCRALRGLSDEEIVKAMESGVPVHELTHEELLEIFPKLRMVADDYNSDQGSLVLGNANSFDDSRPALLQVPSKAIKPALGLQSLYEYDFTSGKHMNVVYRSSGAGPKSSIRVMEYEAPPQSTNPRFAIIQVEASTISQTDCRTRRDGWFGNKRIEFPNTPGVDIVGKIYRIDAESSRQSGLKKGDRIIALVSQGGNSRYLLTEADSLVKMTEKVDPAEAVCLMETYMTAFQSLHHNQSFLTRYRKNSLQGKTILIIGGMSETMTQAMSQLARYAGAKSIFATSKRKRYKSLSENGILPLPTDPLEWWEQLAGGVDLLVSLDEEVIPLHHKLLKLDGVVVISSSEFHEDLMNDGAADMKRNAIICSTVRSRGLAQTTHYDLYEEWEKNRVRAKKDIRYLIDLLEKRSIVPRVIDRVPLEKVAEIQGVLEKQRVKGHYVCEPWLVSKSRAVSL